MIVTPAATTRAIDAINAYDAYGAVVRSAGRFGLNPASPAVPGALRELKRYLTLLAYHPQQTFALSPIAARMLYAFNLCTDAYAGFCVDAYGGFGSQPSVRHDVMPRVDVLQTARRNTRTAMSRHFGHALAVGGGFTSTYYLSLATDDVA